jgi:hypothetical protein
LPRGCATEEVAARLPSRDLAKDLPLTEIGFRRVPRAAIQKGDRCSPAPRAWAGAVRGLSSLAKTSSCLIDGRKLSFAYDAALE